MTGTHMLRAFHEFPHNVAHVVESQPELEPES
jgi:hypothetical protein